MNYSFVEIGSPNGLNLVAYADNNTVGLSIQPLQVHLDELPSRDSVVKIAAVVAEEGERRVETLHYIPPATVEENNLLHSFKTIVGLGEMHSQHTAHNVQSFVETSQVDVIPLAEIFETHEVEKIGCFYVHTGNGDEAKIITQLIPILNSWETEEWPNIIRFGQTGVDSVSLNTCILSYEALGYNVFKDSADIEMFKQV